MPAYGIGQSMFANYFFKQIEILEAMKRDRWVDTMMAKLNFYAMSFILQVLFEDIYLLLLKNREKRNK